MGEDQDSAAAVIVWRAITLRPAAEQDEPFLYQVYKLSRVEEFSMSGSGELQFDLLMRMQYSARKASYESNYPDALHDIIIAGGENASHIWVFRDETEVRVIDIAIAGEFQNQGIGASP